MSGIRFIFPKDSLCGHSRKVNSKAETQLKAIQGDLGSFFEYFWAESGSEN